MRSLGMARYRFLTAVRSSGALFAVLLGAAVLVLLPMDDLFVSRSMSWGSITYAMRTSASAVSAIYCTHLLILLGSCEVIARRAKRKTPEAIDLLITAPITPAESFTGTVAGIFATVMAAHLAMLPLLALAIAISPLPSVVFLVLELAVVAMVAIGSAGAAWASNAEGPWGRTRTLRGLALFLLLGLGIVMGTTYWEPFRDAVVMTLREPSLHLGEIRSAILNPPLFVGGLILLYASFMAYFFVDSARSSERF